MLKSRPLPLFLCLVALMVSGCAARPPFEPETAPLVGPNAVGACETINAQRPAVTSFRSMAESTVTSGRSSVSFRYVIVARNPDSLRIDLLPPEGAFTLGMLIAQGSDVRVINTQEKTYSRQSGDAAAALEQFLGLRGISPKVVEGLVTGVPPLFDCSQAVAFEEPNGTTIVIDERDRVAWTVSTEGARVRAFHVLERQEDSVRMEGMLYYSRGQSPSSMSLSVFDPREAHGVVLFKRITLNPPIADEVFEVSVPESYARVE